MVAMGFFIGLRFGVMVAGDMVQPLLQSPDMSLGDTVLNWAGPVTPNIQCLGAINA